MDDRPDGPGETTEATVAPRLGRAAALASAPNHIRWDLGERAAGLPRQRLCVVRIAAGRTLGIPGDACRGLETLGEATPMPLAPPHVRGLVHVRGRILAWVDLARFVGTPAPRHEDGPRTGLILALPDGEICLQVDEVVSFEPFEVDDAFPYRDPELGRLGELVSEAVPREDGSPLPLLDPSAVLRRLRIAPPPRGTPGEARP